MTQEKKDKLIAVLKNYDNIASMIEDLLEPVSKVMEKHSCNDEEACNLKIQAEDYLSKYGKLTMNATTKAVRNVINDNIPTTTEEEEEEKTTVKQKEGVTVDVR